jgi:hypothetical protein
MRGGFSNKPKILHGAFVEYGLSLNTYPVVFQFNPEQLTRKHSRSFSGPKVGETDLTLREFHQDTTELSTIQKQQKVTLEEETINFEILLDATDQLEEAKENQIKTHFGIEPQLAALELMLHPKGENSLLKHKGYSYTRKSNPPVILFIWGRHRVLPVNINSLDITETAFNTHLYPTRANATVALTVIEGKNPPYRIHTKEMQGLKIVAATSSHDAVKMVIPRF